MHRVSSRLLVKSVRSSHFGFFEASVFASNGPAPSPVPFIIDHHTSPATRNCIFPTICLNCQGLFRRGVLEDVDLVQHPQSLERIAVRLHGSFVRELDPQFLTVTAEAAVRGVGGRTRLRWCGLRVPDLHRLGRGVRRPRGQHSGRHQTQRQHRPAHHTQFREHHAFEYLIHELGRAGRDRPGERVTRCDHRRHFRCLRQAAPMESRRGRSRSL